MSARSTAESDGAIENSMDVASCAGCSPHQERFRDDCEESYSSDLHIKVIFFLDLETRKNLIIYLIQKINPNQIGSFLVNWAFFFYFITLDGKTPPAAEGRQPPRTAARRRRRTPESPPRPTSTPCPRPTTSSPLRPSPPSIGPLDACSDPPAPLVPLSTLQCARAATGLSASCSF